MEDIAPGLLLRIRSDFQKRMEESKEIQVLYQKIQSGSATYADASDYAYQIGQALSQAFGENLGSAVLPDGRMYYNIADRILRPLLEEDYSIVAKAAQMVQQALNQQAGIGITAQTAAVNLDRIQGIVDKVSNAEVFDDVAWVLDEPVKNFSMNVVDETIRQNVNFQGRSGLHPKVIRKAERKCCSWCSNLAGEYEYPDVPEDVYRRHENCRCTVEYDPGSGRRQNIYTKKWTTTTEAAKIEARKVLGLRVNQTAIREVSNHALEQMANRSVTMEAIQDAISKPLQIKPVKYDDQGRPSFVVVGRKATAAINPETGAIITTYPTHSKTARKLTKGK